MLPDAENYCTKAQQVSLFAEQFVFQGLKFEVIPSTFEENLDKSKFEHPYEYAKETARQKTLQVAQKLQQDNVIEL